MRLLILYLLIGIVFSLSYNADKAIFYARKYCQHYNPQYDDLGRLGGDAAHFVSQCLIAGGLSLAECDGLNYDGTILGAENLKRCLQRKGWTYSSEITDKFKPGYPFFNKFNNHVKLATAVNKKTITFCSHTRDYCEQNTIIDDSYYFYFLN